ncbi:MAG: diflavin oxidoreductase [Akkermansiaceae bacterium]
MPIPTIPTEAPFSQKQRDWLNGYLAGLFSNGSQFGSTAAADLGAITFLFGTQTGGSEMLCRKFGKDAKKQGFTPAVIDMADYGDIDWSTQSRVIIVTSTYGEGDMPDNAQDFWDSLQSDDAPDLSNIEFGVLSLGDSNYTHFCEAGKLFDKRLEELGAKRVHDRVDCDVDFEDPAAEWIQGLLPKWSGVEVESSEEDDAIPGLNKALPFTAKLSKNEILSGSNSQKETRHIEINLGGAKWQYEVGDALGVWPENCPEFVNEILLATGLEGTQEITTDKRENMSLRHSLTSYYDLSSFIGSDIEPATDAQEFTSTLKKLQPRLYSISSSPKAHQDEVHLTVGIVRYEIDGKAHKGVCSTYLADADTRMPSDKSLSVFLHKSPSFRLPADTTAPVIMVGPGTGIAPFRAFLEERKATASEGKNWLFFGDQTRSEDYLYEDQLNTYLEDGTLDQLSLAFSRDQEEKIYVQHLMINQAAELWQWFEDGASFYVCGDASRMAKDVDDALHTIAQTAGNLSEEESVDWVKALKRGKRYLRDVY